MRRVSTALVALALTSSPLQALAGTADAALAQTLFEEGVRLMEAKRYGEACPKLAESHRLDPAGGTILDLAICLEKEGKLASAYVAYDEALARAKKDGEKGREATARARLEALRVLVAKVIIEVDAGARRLEGLDLRLDGASVREQAWGSAIPVDPGPHVITAQASGKRALRVELRVDKAGVVHTVTVPPLVDLAPSAVQAKGTKEPGEPVGDGGGRRKVGFVLGGTGIALLAAGTVAGVLAIDRHAESDRLCPGGRCTKEGAEAEDAANRLAWGANIAIGAGLLAGGLGAYFLFWRGDSQVKIAPSLAGAAVLGKF